ncbi:MAG: hypothetical protein JSS57_24075 [Proteobacteria bacterium]|nr:hypothetical protein [Pseudomonadota bacterium]RTL40046.1 MAG: hypothetical protein EKK49_03255 [Rhodocyclaceae bacterium]
MYNIWLIGGAVLSGIAALLHVLIVWGGAPWYRFFGAGEGMASAAAAGQLYPAVVTLCIALVLSAWAAYALAGAGVLTALPRQKAVLVAITAIYLMRGLAILPLLVFASQQATPFLVWSSLICLGYGIVHLVGVAQAWTRL